MSLQNHSLYDCLWLLTVLEIHPTMRQRKATCTTLVCACFLLLGSWYLLTHRMYRNLQTSVADWMSHSTEVGPQPHSTHTSTTCSPVLWQTVVLWHLNLTTRVQMVLTMRWCCWKLTDWTLAGQRGLGLSHPVGRVLIKTMLTLGQPAVDTRKTSASGQLPQAMTMWSSDTCLVVCSVCKCLVDCPWGWDHHYLMSLTHGATHHPLSGDWITAQYSQTGERPSLEKPRISKLCKTITVNRHLLYCSTHITSEMGWSKCKGSRKPVNLEWGEWTWAPRRRWTYTDSTSAN